MRLLEQDEFTSADFGQHLAPHQGEPLSRYGVYAVAGVLSAGMDVPSLADNCRAVLYHFSVGDCRTAWPATYRACETICLFDESAIDHKEANARLANAVSEIRAHLPARKGHLRLVGGTN